MSISFDEYLTRFGYASRRHCIYKKRLNELLETFPNQDRFTPGDLLACAGNNHSKRGQMKVIGDYLRLSLKMGGTAAETPARIIGEHSQDFLRSLTAKNYRPCTVSSYRRTLKSLATFLEDRGIERVSQVDREALNAFKTDLFLRKTRMGKRLAVSTQKGKLISIQQFFVYLTREGLLTVNPARRLTLPREERRISRNVFSADEMRRFFDCIDTASVYGFMDRCIFELQYSTGIRAGEVVSLQLSGVNLEDQLVSVIGGKGDKDHVAVLTTICRRYLEKWLTDVRGKFLASGAESDYLFPSVSGNKLDEHYLARRVRRYADLAGVSRHLSPHAFRRSLATHMLDKGVDLRFIQRLLGHERINTTMKYISVSQENLRGAILRFHPREQNQVIGEVLFKGDRRYGLAAG